MSKIGPQNQQVKRPAVATDTPWLALADWRQANSALLYLCTRHQRALTSVRGAAQDLKNGLETLFPLLDSLCMQTCCKCSAPCCHVATVWFDFRDLIFMHLSGQVIATTQLSRGRDGTCHCCGPEGCRLPRLSRPWTCSWYLCPAQKDLLAKMPGKALVMFSETVATIKGLRKRLEAEFIQITS